ncbi:Aste57867_22969 [Aphanomyces stellatus]|uniref:Aste57867_22969 protein n=1 Tax=Aphanomyces stellatus TaxID=120398 RepID=A0A485LNC4_9STRA|nr:hypothetical protein As57867_022898 [Aphanomyces stellatus]VFT99619.1 Aste57867_22969 [Aphanomyces stellatus]
MERQHGWMWKLILGSVLVGLVGYMSPLLLKESPDQRRATLVTTHVDLQKKGESVKQQFAQLKHELDEYQTSVGDIWKITALRKMREEQVLAESQEHLDGIKSWLEERRESMEKLMAETTDGIQDALSILREKTTAPHEEHPDEAPKDDEPHTNVDVPVESSDDDRIPTENTPTPSQPSAQVESPVIVNPDAGKKPPPVPRRPHPVPPKKKKPLPPAPIDPPPPPPVTLSTAKTAFPITLTQAVVGFCIVLVTLVAFSMISEYRTGEPSFFSPRRKPKRDPNDEMAGSYVDLQYNTREGIASATPCVNLVVKIVLTPTPFHPGIDTACVPVVQQRTTMDKLGFGKKALNVKALWKKLEFTVKTAKLEQNQLKKYQAVQTQALVEAQKQLLAEGQHLTDAELQQARPANDDGSGLYSRESLILRYGLRRHEGIVQAVQNLWKVAAPRDDLGCLVRAGYVSFYMCVAKYLDASFDHASATATVEAEWENDRKGNESMGFALFFDSIFQLADLWVDSLDPDDYVHFLNGIAANVFIPKSYRLKEAADITTIKRDETSDDEDDEEEDESDDERDKKRKPPAKETSRPASREAVTKKATGNTTEKTNVAKKKADNEEKNKAAALQKKAAQNKAHNESASPNPSILQAPRPHISTATTTAKLQSHALHESERRRDHQAEQSHHEAPQVPLQQQAGKSAAKSTTTMLAFPGDGDAGGADGDEDDQTHGRDARNGVHQLGNGAMMRGGSKTDLKAKDAPRTYSNNETSDDVVEKQAVAPRLMGFASARHLPNDAANQAEKRRPKGEPTKQNPKKGKLKLEQIMTSQTDKRVGKGSFVAGAIPTAKGLESKQKTQCVDEDGADEDGTSLSPWDVPTVISDETNLAKTIRVHIQPARARFNLDDALVSDVEGEYHDGGLHRDKMRGGALVKVKASPPDEDDIPADTISPEKSSGGGGMGSVVIGTSIPKPKHSPLMAHDLAILTRRDPPPPRCLSPLVDIAAPSTLVDDLSPPRRRETRSPRTFLRAAKMQRQAPFRPSPRGLAAAPNTQSLPVLLAENPSTSALLTINRREFTLERSQCTERHGPSRIALLKIKQKVNKTQHFAGRLMDNSIMLIEDD